MLKYEYGRPLSGHTSLKIGGPAFCWLEADNFKDILEAISVAESNRKKVAVIGNGTNILVQDEGFDGVVLNLGRGFDYIEKEEERIVKVGAATSLSKLVKKTSQWNLTGCEFLSGIPGSFGGAVFMNAGVREFKDEGRLKEIKDIILDVDILDFKNKKKKTLKKQEIPFTYRHSGLDRKCILGARIKLEKAQKKDINNRIDAYLKKRAWMQKLGLPSAGSIFKNPDPNNPAAKLIEVCGLKGARIGKAEISRIHANFIVNIGGATSKDVLDLISLVKYRVKEKFNTDLELELQTIS